jgi:hypothetical protein
MTRELVRRPIGAVRVLAPDAIAEHGERALAPLLGRLEDEAHRSVEAALLGQDLRAAQQHGRVAVNGRTRA